MGNERININGVVMTMLGTVLAFMAGWVLQINTEVALLNQKIEAESLRNDETRVQYARMSESIGKLDKTLSLLIDRLDRNMQANLPELMNK